MRVSSFPSFVRGDTVTMEFKTGLDLAHVSSAVLVIEQCGYTITKEGDALEVSGGSVRGTLTPSESMTLIPGRVSVQLSLRFEDGTVFSSDPETWMVENRVGGSTGSSTVLADAEFSAFVGIPVPAPHPVLEGRDLLDQHPITAVTGLEDALASKADGVATAQALATKADADETARAIEGRVGRDEFSRAMDGKADTAALTGETMLRTEGDTALRMLISDEVRDRRDAVASEASARDAAVSSLSTRIDRKQDRLTAGKNVTIIDGVISAAGTEYGQATNTAPGLMSASDKAKLDTVAKGAEPNVIESVRVNGSPLTVTSDGAVNVDLTGYATKADLSTIPKWDKVVVDKLPTTGIQLDKIYLVPNSGSGTNSRDEYIYVDGKWELIGTTETDISGKQDVITGAASTVTSADLTAGRVLVSDSSGKIAVDSSVTVAELRFLDGVKSNVQTQMDAEATARANADADIRRAVDAEASARDAAVKAEATARANAVGTLQSNINGKVSKSGDTMTGNLTLTAGTERGIIVNRTDRALGDVWGRYTWNRSYDKNAFLIGDLILTNDATSTTYSIKAYNKDTSGNTTTASLSIYARSDGVNYASAPTPPDKSDNGTKIATTAWVNSASTVVHTSGNDIIAGTKEFTGQLTASGVYATIRIQNKGLDKTVIPSEARYSRIRFTDVNDASCGAVGCWSTEDGLRRASLRVYKSTDDPNSTKYGEAIIESVYDINNDVLYATAPATRASGYGTTDIVTAGWADAKYVDVAGDTMTGRLTSTAGVYNPIVLKNTTRSKTAGTQDYGQGVYFLDNENKQCSFIYSIGSTDADTGVVSSKTLVSALMTNPETGNEIYCTLHLNANSDGTTSASVPTPTDKACNNAQIATTAWVNSASTVVHTSGNETIAGAKTFLTRIMTSHSGTVGPGLKNTGFDVKGAGSTYAKPFSIDAYDTNSNLTMCIMYERGADDTRTVKLAGWGASVSASIGVTIKGDVVYGMAPATPSNAKANEIATAGWVDNKIASQRAETWTFTLDDGSTVTKEVLVR